MPLVYAVALAVTVGVLGYLAGLDVGRADAERLRLYEDELEAPEDGQLDLGRPGPRMTPGPGVMSPTMSRGLTTGAKRR